MNSVVERELSSYWEVELQRDSRTAGEQALHSGHVRSPHIHVTPRSPTEHSALLSATAAGSQIESGSPSFFLFISLFLGFLLSHLALILCYSTFRISCFFCSLLHFRSTPSIENEYILLQVERLFLILIKYARFSSQEYSLNHQTVSL